jgi:hypothetical protein
VASPRTPLIFPYIALYLSPCRKNNFVTRPCSGLSILIGLSSVLTFDKMVH